MSENVLYLSSKYTKSVVYEKSAFFVASKGFRHKKRQIPNYEIMFVTNGVLYYQEGQRQYELSKGDVFIASPNITHFGYYPSEEGASFYWVHYFLTDANAVRFDNGYFHIRDDIRLLQLFKQLLHIANSNIYPLEALNQTVALILAEISVGSMTQGGKNEKLDEISAWICSQTDGRLLKVFDVEERFGAQVHRLWKANGSASNMSLNDYIIAQRLELAKRYLLSTNIYIKEIAARLGYNSPDNFVKFFKYHEHITPGEFRNGYYNTLIHNR